MVERWKSQKGNMCYKRKVMSKPIFIDYKIAFMGQTGRGKSTIMNALFGTDFKIDSVKECTTCINSSTFINKDKRNHKEAFTIIDTPGIGASTDKDEIYEPYYLQTLSIADCIVWVTNMQRLDKLDQEFFLKYKESFRPEIKYIICINQIDIISPKDLKEGEMAWDIKYNRPAPILNHLLYDDNGRINLVKKKLVKYLPKDCEIIPVNALYKYGLENLKNKIFEE